MSHPKRTQDILAPQGRHRLHRALGAVTMVAGGLIARGRVYLEGPTTPNRTAGMPRRTSASVGSSPRW